MYFRTLGCQLVMRCSTKTPLASRCLMFQARPSFSIALELLTSLHWKRNRLLSDFNSDATWQTTPWFTKLAVFFHDSWSVDWLALPLSMPNWEECITPQSTLAFTLSNVIKCKYEYKLNRHKMYRYDGIQLLYLYFDIKIIVFSRRHLTHL